MRNLCEGAWHSCSDLANFATNGHVRGGWGHSEEYCARAWAMEHEAFAHFFEASMGDSMQNPMTVSSVNVPSGKNVDKRQKGGRTE